MPHLSFLTQADRQRLAEALIKNAKEDPKKVIKEIRTIPKAKAPKPK